MTKTKKVILAIILLIVTLNAIWFINFMTYKFGLEGYTKDGDSYTKDVDNYSLLVKPPDYLSLTGNYAIANQTITIIVWAELFNKGHEFGIEVDDKKTSITYQFLVNEDMSYKEINNGFTYDEEMRIKEILVENESLLKEMFIIVKSEWL